MFSYLFPGQPSAFPCVSVRQHSAQGQKWLDVDAARKKNHSYVGPSGVMIGNLSSP